MYLRAIHAEKDIPSLRRFIYDNPLGLLITSIESPSASFPKIQCTHIPWVIDVQDNASETELGVIRGHLAKANPHSKALAEAAQDETAGLSQDSTLLEEVTVIFNGPAHHYVTPKFYVDTKPDTGKVVPTWNYSAVQVYGKAKIFWDSSSQETSNFLQTQISDLSQHAETQVMGYQKPWGVADAPERYISIMKKSITGIEIKIDRLEGKYKMSQESNAADRKGVIDGFKSLDSDVGNAMAATVEERAAHRLMSVK